MTVGGGGIVDPKPSTRCLFRAVEEGVRKGGVAAVDAGERQGVLFTHKFVSLLLALTGELAEGEMVALKPLISTTI